MSPLQQLLFYVLVLLAYAALLGVPHGPLAAAAFVGGWVSVIGLALELVSG